ncbi:aldo/keto reductase [Microbacterium sp. YY-01]|uniref:aldo/keto reductase n=1 Tax=Microbacterium sp. YY-01 TaxID=3421634 RepID=UPI003D187614
MSSTDRPAAPTMPTLGYGAANVGNLFRELSDEQAWDILETAWQSGIRYFDTAPHYGLGLSERRLGAFLQTKPRDEFIVSTKVGRLLRPNPHDDGGLDTDNDFVVRTELRREWDFTEQGIRTSIAESCEQLGLDYVDIAYLHDPERHSLEQALAEALPALQTLRAENTVAQIGVGSMVSEALAASVRRADLDIIMVAGRYTLLEQPAAAEVLPACDETGTGIVAASVFNSGLLAREAPNREDRYEYGRVPEPLWNRLLRITDICARYSVPLPAAAMQFPLLAPAVRSVVVGGSRPEHLRSNADYAALVIPDDLWRELESEELIPHREAKEHPDA